MGAWGIFHWLGEDLDKLKVLRSMTKNAEQISMLDEIIDDIEKNIKKEGK